MSKLLARQRIELKFGDVLLDPYQGRGMVYAVTASGLPMIAYENECVLGGVTDKVRLLGSIFDLPLPAGASPSGAEDCAGRSGPYLNPID